jgi:hypothetical protein
MIFAGGRAAHSRVRPPIGRSAVLHFFLAYRLTGVFFLVYRS